MITLKEIESQVIAIEIIEDRLRHPNHEGRWGAGFKRSQRLREAGYDYNYIQKLANDWFINNVLREWVKNGQ